MQKGWWCLFCWHVVCFVHLSGGLQQNVFRHTKGGHSGSFPKPRGSFRESAWRIEALTEQCPSYFELMKRGTQHKRSLRGKSAVELGHGLRLVKFAGGIRLS